MPIPGKNAVGLKGFPTPDTPAGTEGYLLFRFSRENDWAGLLLGAAQALSHDYNWYEWGTMSPEEAAEAWRVIVQDAPYNLIDLPETVPTPFWDDVSDTDDQAETDIQAWYGYVPDATLPPGELTFIESAAIWSFTGFIAVAAAPAAGLYPAILFHTIAPKFVLAMRQGDFAQIIRIIVDGEQAAQIDTSTYAPNALIELPIVPDPELATHELMIVSVEQGEFMSVGASVGRATNFTGQSGNPIVWTVETYDTDNMFDPAANTRLTINTAGIYIVNLAIWVYHNDVAANAQAYIRRNGDSNNRIVYSTTGEPQGLMNLTRIINLDAGDYLEAVYVCSAAGNAAIGTVTYSPKFSAQRIAPSP